MMFQLSLAGLFPVWITHDRKKDRLPSLDV